MTHLLTLSLFLLISMPAMALEIKKDVDCAAAGVTASGWKQWKLRETSKPKKMKNRYSSPPPITSTIDVPVDVPKDVIVHFTYTATIAWQDRPTPTYDTILGEGRAYHSKNGGLTLDIKHSHHFRVHKLVFSSITCDQAFIPEEERCSDSGGELPESLEEGEDYQWIQERSNTD
jgi:hypothetical protein